MSVEIHQPELEALIQRRMASGAFQDVEDLLFHALESAPERAPSGGQTAPKETLDEMFARVRGLADDLDFSRDRSECRVVDFS